ncbi:MAG: glycosyltransferase family 4 protein [Acidobacteria bacterium]|nr:glycosyltransferase family 4 protein [Acidobacteriota bacterium]
MTAARHLRIAPLAMSERRIKVLFLIDSLGPGGAERLMVDLLPRLREIGVDSEVVAIQERHGNPVADDLRKVGVSVSTIGIERLRERGALARVMAAVQDTSPDVIHTQLEVADILGSIAGFRLDIPTIATIHTLDHPRPWSREAARFRVMAWTLRRRSQRVIAVSESARSHVLRKVGLRKRHTITIHNGINLTPFLETDHATRHRAREELDIAPNAQVVATVAVLRKPKGIDDMLEALPALLNNHPLLRYLIVGDGPHRTALQAKAAALGIHESVHFAGESADVAEMLAAADIFVLPSSTEALPTVLIQAMAVGLPVVATAVGGIPELVEHGTTGILVPLGNPLRLSEAIDRLLGSPRQRYAMGLTGRRSAKDRFSIERQASRLADEYRVLVSRAEKS